ncbi:MAG: hypothetical protein ABF370_08120 [Verrucomicrobiales bacterium]
MKRILSPILLICLIWESPANDNAANLWPNGSFEDGSNLDSPTPELTGWSAFGSNSAIDVVISDATTDGEHALAIVDDDPAGYGEWFSELQLAGLVNEGDSLEVSWQEMFSVDFSEMRISILFFNGEGSVATQNHFVTRGESEGWTGTAATSPFVGRNETVVVPPGAVRMNVSLVSGGPSETTGFMAIDSLCVRRPSQPIILADNIWPNATFEVGADLDDPASEVEGWNRGGSDVGIDQVTAEVSVSPSHALIVRDENEQGFGEWFADLNLADLAMAGDTLQLQWFEIFNVTGSEMRLTALFFNDTDQVVGERHFTASGNSDGWLGTLAGSSFSQRNESLTISDNAVRMRLSLVSGGSEATTGLMVIDDLSVAVAAEPQVLTNNFWDNPGFEEGTNLDEPIGDVVGWSRGGSDATINQVSKATSLSPSHALAVIDDSTENFGEWFADQALDDVAESGDVLDVQWFEIHDISENGEMRVSIMFFDGNDSVLGENHSVTRGQSGGWTGDLETSSFTRYNTQVIVPDNAIKMRVSLVSGGPVETTGVMLIDDLSVALLAKGEIIPGNIWPNPTFELGSQLDNPSVASPSGWNRGGSNSSIDVVVSENSVSPSHALAVIDDDENGFGEWYQSFPFGESVKSGDELQLRWFEMFNTEGDMRLSFLFFDAGGAILEQRHFIVSGESEGWESGIASSTFTKREEFLLVPENATRMQLGLVSGGSEAVTGLYVIDDLSIASPSGGPLEVTGLEFDSAANALTISWKSLANKSYTVEFSSDLSDWSDDVKSNISATGEETSHTFQHPGLSTAFFRVLEE